MRATGLVDMTSRCEAKTDAIPDPDDEELLHLYEFRVLASWAKDVWVLLATEFSELHDFESGIPKKLDDHIAQIALFSSRLGSYLRSDL